ncbi:MAG: hypothetical protein RL068_520 [Actinomycetota bacterium]|jgi:sugar/nucleoside kinase (ribokinase family)
MSPRVLVIGDLINDIVVNALAPTRPDTDTHARIEVKPGGSAANFACWLASLGVETTLASRVAAADVTAITADLATWNVAAALQADENEPTGAIVVLVEGNLRTFYTQRGANAKLQLDQLPAFSGFDLVYISGYTIASQPDPEVFRRFISQLQAAGVQVAVDPGSAGFIADYSPVRFLEAVHGVDYLFPSLAEGRLLSGEDQPEIIAKFFSQRARHTVLTMGDQGAIHCHNDQLNFGQALESVVVDPIGAGDAFAAGFLATILEGQDSSNALQVGLKLGAKAVGIAGGRPS